MLRIMTAQVSAQIKAIVSVVKQVHNQVLVVHKGFYSATSGSVLSMAVLVNSRL